MILTRRPVRLFDVDAVGAAAAAALLMVGYLAVYAPMRTAARGAGQAMAELAQRERELAEGQVRLARCADDLQRLEDAIAARRAVAGLSGQLTELTADLLKADEQHGIQFSQIVPQGEVIESGVAMTDVRLVAKGDWPSLIAFLRDLSARHPSHEVRSLEVARHVSEADGECQIGLCIRLHARAGSISNAESAP